jgi:protocatechuate 3,4-dioxygenase beta subunit
VDEAPNADSNINDNQAVVPSDNGVGGITAGPVVSSTPFNLFAADGGALGNNIVTTATATTVNPTIDFGVRQPLALGDAVWFDTNNNGRYDANEAPVNGVTVTLWFSTPGGYAAILTATTDVNGRYVFTNLIPGQYVVRIPNENFGPGGPLENARTSTDVAGITEIGDNNIGETQTGSDNGYEMGFGPMGAGVTGYVQSVPITLEEDTEPISPTQEATTGSGGRDVPPHHGDNDTNMSIDFGFYRLVLGSAVWTTGTTTGFGMRANREWEPATNTVTVTLFLNGLPISVTTTDANGLYTFTGMMSETYIVQIEVPRDYVSSDPDEVNPNGNINDGSASVQDNGLGGITGGQIITSGPIDLPPGYLGALTNNIVTTATGTTNNPTLDFGVRQPLALGDTVWFDVNDNGRLDASDTGIQGVVVTLWTTDTDGTFRAILTATTTITGYYVFTNLTPGDYVVRLPASNFEGAGALVNYRSSDLTSGTPNDDIENDDNGIEVGVMGAGGYVSSGVITLQPDLEPVPDNNDPIPYHGENETNMTVDFGFYRLYVASGVWNDRNNNGIRDAGEPTMGNLPTNTVTVTLFLNGVALMTTTTDANGLYTFTNLLSGTYQVQITMPPNYRSSDVDEAPNADSNINDNQTVLPSDNGVGGITAGPVVSSTVFNLFAGNGGALGNNIVTTATATTVNPTIDFGVRQPLVLGDGVWFDTNNNGRYDANELPAAGVTVTLWMSGMQIGTAVTDINGRYVFTNLFPGQYGRIGAENFAVGGPLENARSSSDVAGITEVGDANIGEASLGGDNGYEVGFGALGAGAAGYVESGPITLEEDTEPTNEGGLDVPPNHGDNDTNMSVDFGFYRQEIGSAIWNDLNGNGVVDGLEAPYTAEPITVTLLNAAGAVMGQIVTTNGFYTFTGVPSGTYVVSITIPSSYMSTGWMTATVGVDNNNNGAAVGLFIATTPFTATPGTSIGAIVSTPANGTTSNPAIDFGLVRVPTAIQLVSLRAARTGQSVAVTWQTSNEANTLGYRIYRSVTAERATATLATAGVIAATGAGTGASYEWVDAAAPSGAAFYWLEEIETSGALTEYGPATVGGVFRGYLPVVGR